MPADYARTRMENSPAATRPPSDVSRFLGSHAHNMRTMRIMFQFGSNAGLTYNQYVK